MFNNVTSKGKQQILFFSSFLFVFRSLNRNFDAVEVTHIRKKKDFVSFLLYFAH